MARKKSEPTTTGANRATMGTEAYKLGVDQPSVKDLRAGMVVPRSGNAKGGVDPGAGTATRRGQVMAQTTLGAQYRITAKRGPYSTTDARTQANGRIVPSVTGSSRNFRSAY